MTFISAQPSVVRAIKQRDLLNVWVRLYQRLGHLPCIKDYHPDRIADESSEMVSYRVHQDGSPQPRFAINRNGNRMASAYGQPSQETDLAEFLGPLRVAAIMPGYFMCVSRALPVYTINVVTDANGRTVACERLLLPFSDATPADPADPAKPGMVTRIIASLKTICEDGGFEILNLMPDDQVLAAPTLSAVIDTELHWRGFGATPANDIQIS